MRSKSPEAIARDKLAEFFKVDEDYQFWVRYITIGLKDQKFVLKASVKEENEIVKSLPKEIDGFAVEIIMSPEEEGDEEREFSIKIERAIKEGNEIRMRSLQNSGYRRSYPGQRFR